MDIEWKYKIGLVDENVFAEIEKERGVMIPAELKEFIKENNAATPSKYNFMVGNVEKVFGAVLSFNRGETDTDTVFTALAVVEDGQLIPFGIDSFGNYICYSISNDEVVFWDHENGTVTSTEKNLTEFVSSLY